MKHSRHGELPFNEREAGVSATHMDDLLELAQRLADIPSLIGDIAAGAEFELLTDSLSVGGEDQGGGEEPPPRTADEYRDYILGVLREAATIEIGNGNKFVGDTHVQAANFLKHYALGEIDLPAEAVVEIYKHMEQSDKKPYFKNYVSEGLQQKLDPLVWLAVSRPADFISSLSRVFKTLAELRVLADTPLNDDLKMMMTLQRGMSERLQSLEQPASTEIIRRAAVNIDGLFDCVRGKHQGDKSAIELKFDGRLTRLTSNPDANYPAHLSVERQDSAEEGFFGWKYSIEYMMGDGRLSKHIMLYGEDFMEGKIKSWRESDWQALSFREAVNLEVDMRDLRDIKEHRPLAFLMHVETESADFNLNI